MARTISMILTIALVITSTGFANLQNVEAKSAVKSIKVKGAKKNLTLKVGDKKTYKVKVKAKKKNNKFSAKSSNKKVVSVKKKGSKITIMAVAVGNAKVTVKAKSNKKKKYVINIKVVSKGNNSKTATQGDTKKPSGKEGDNGKTTPDSNVSEKEHFEDVIVDTAKVGEDIGGGFTDHLAKKRIIGIEGSVEGLYFDIEDEDSIRVSGTIYQAGKYEVVVRIEGTDSEEYDYKFVFLVADDNNIEAYSYDKNIYLWDRSGYSDGEDGEDEEDWQSRVWMIICGGSGEYEYKITSNPNNAFTLSSAENSSYDYTTKALQYRYDGVGTYKATVRITDKKNPNLYTDCECKITVRMSHLITGTITDGKGNPITHASVDFEEINGDDDFYAQTDSEGKYEAYLEGGKYEITVEYNDKEYSKTKKVINSDLNNLNFTIPDLYTVTVTSDEMNIDDEESWYYVYEDEEGEHKHSFGSGSKLLLAKGSYSLSTDDNYAIIDKQFCKYKAVINMNVQSDMTVKANVTKTVFKPESTAFSEGLNTINVGHEYKIYKFVAPSNGVYSFESDFDGRDPALKLYNSDYEKIGEADDMDYNDNRDFKLDAELKQGKTYYAAIRVWGVEEPVQGKVNIKKTK